MSAAPRGGWVATAPVRADLAGGTLDLWPLGLLHPGGITVASAVSLFVEARALPAEREGWTRVRSRDLGLARSFRAAKRAESRGKLELLELVACAAGPEQGLVLDCLSPVRAGSGLGTSSALGVAAAAAALRLGGHRARPERVVPLVRDLEAQVLGIPTGTQDHEAAWRGGIVLLEHRAGGPLVRRLAGPLVRALGERLVLVDSGQARSSGPSNWDMVRRRIDGDAAAVRALSEVAEAGRRAAEALARGDWRALGRAMVRDLAAREEWSPLVLTPALSAIFEAALRSGAIGYRVCGAGGGGYAVVLVEPARRERAVREIAATGATVSPARPVTRGLRLSRAADRR